MEAVQYLNNTDDLPHHVVFDLDRPHRIVVTGIYEFPFGRGKRLARSAGGLVNHIIGGWQIQAIYTGQSGPPLVWGNVIYRGKFADIRLPGKGRSIERWFNTEGFERNPRMQLASNIRTFPLRISGTRADGINLWDIGLFKNFHLWEAVRLEVRAEAEGALNHPCFGARNITPTSTLFGRVTSTQEAEGARRIFLGLKLIF